VEIVYDQPDAVVGWRAPVVVVWWRRAPNLQSAITVGDTATRLMQTYGVGVIFVVLTEASHGVPERAAADAMGKTTRAVEKFVVAHAFVIEGTGLKASAIRQSVKMLQSFTRVIFPWTIAQSPEEGIMWVARKAKFLTEEEAVVILNDVKQLRAARGGA